MSPLRRRLTFIAPYTAFLVAPALPGTARRITEQGPHEQLMARKGLYHRLYRHQYQEILGKT